MKEQRGGLRDEHTGNRKQTIKNNRKCLFVATVSTDSAVFVATLPVECQ